jgi:hypothetical protein
VSQAMNENEVVRRRLLLLTLVGCRHQSTMLLKEQLLIGLSDRASTPASLPVSLYQARKPVDLTTTPPPSSLSAS